MNTGGLGQIASRNIRGVAEFFDRGLHALPGLWTDFRVPTEDTRYCHRRHTDMPGHFVHRHSTPTTSCFCFFHNPLRLALCRHYLPPTMPALATPSTIDSQTHSILQRPAAQAIDGRYAWRAWIGCSAANGRQEMLRAGVSSPCLTYES